MLRVHPCARRGDRSAFGAQDQEAGSSLRTQGRPPAAAAASAAVAACAGFIPAHAGETLMYNLMIRNETLRIWVAPIHNFKQPECALAC